MDQHRSPIRDWLAVILIAFALVWQLNPDHSIGPDVLWGLDAWQWKGPIAIGLLVVFLGIPTLWDWWRDRKRD